MKKRLEHRLEEIILIILILLNVFAFIEFLSGDIHFIKNIIAWASLGYLLYHISLTRIFFGTKNKIVDITLIITFFLFIVKDLIYFASIALEEVNIFTSFYSFMIINKLIITKITFITAGILLILHALYLTFNIHVKKPSLMHVIHEEGIPKTLVKRTERFLIVFFILIGFFVIIFNLMMEWLAVAVHSSLLVFALLFYFFTLFRRHHKRFNAEHLIFKIGNLAEEFYGGFLELFHTKRIWLGISGILVLHLLTDIGNFIVPYIFNMHDTIYFKTLGEGHLSLYALITKDLVEVYGFNKIALVWVYFFNLLAMLFLLALPAYVWHKLYKKKGFKVSHLSLAVFAAAVMCFILTPAFKIIPIDHEIVFGTGLVGVDITTCSVFEKSLVSLLMTFIISLITGIAVYLLSCGHYIKERIMAFDIAIIDFFTGWYILYFLINIAVYYSHIPQGVLAKLVLQGSYFIAFFLFLFFIVTVIFYAVGFCLFLSETVKEFKYIK